MGLFDELKKLTQPQDDDSDFFEGADESFKPAPAAASSAQLQFENTFGEEPSSNPEPARRPAKAQGEGGSLFGNLGVKKAAKPRTGRMPLSRMSAASHAMADATRPETRMSVHASAIMTSPEPQAEQYGHYSIKPSTNQGTALIIPKSGEDARSLGKPIVATTPLRGGLIKVALP